MHTDPTQQFSVPTAMQLSPFCVHEPPLEPDDDEPDDDEDDAPDDDPPAHCAVIMATKRTTVPRFMHAPAT